FSYPLLHMCLLSFPTRRSSDLVVAAFLQLVVDGHAIVEHETLALPQRLFFGHLLQIVEDASLQVINLVEALLLQIGCGFLAADADRKSTRLNSSHVKISYAVFC